MAEQLVLLELHDPPPAVRAPPDRVWPLDERTVAIGRLGLERARRALRQAACRAA